MPLLIPLLALAACGDGGEPAPALEPPAARARTSEHAARVELQGGPRASDPVAVEPGTASSDDPARPPHASAPEASARQALPRAPRPVGVLHGTVRHARADRPLEGVRLELRAAPDAPADQVLVTDAEGRFRAAPVAPDARPYLVVCAPDPLRVRHGAPVRLLGPAELTGRAPVPVELAEVWVAGVEGRVVDALTGAPLPGVELELRPPGDAAPRVVRSDGRGRIAVDALSGGRIGVHARTEGVRCVAPHVELVHGVDGPWLVRCHVGREVPLRLVGEVPGTATALSVLVCDHDTERTLLRQELLRLDRGTAVLRLPHHAGIDPRYARCLLAVHDEAGLRFGARELRLAELDGEAVVEVELQATGAVRWSVSGHPEGEGLEVPHVAELRTPPGPRSMPLSRLRLGRRRWLPPGAYTLELVARGHGPTEAAVRVEAGEVTDVALEPRPPERTRAVTLRVAAGEDRRADVLLRIAGQPWNAWRVRVGREPEVLRDVPEGELELVPVGGWDGMGVERREAPSGDVEFVLGARGGG